MSTSWKHFPKSRSKPVRGFHRPRYGNPLFAGTSGSKVVRRNSNGGTTRPSRRQAGSGFLDRSRTMMLIAALLIVGGVWYVFWSSAFRITKTEFGGTTPFTEDTLRRALADYESSNALLIFPRNNVLLFSESGAKDAIKNAVYLDDIQISKKLPNTVIVTVKEKTMRAVLERGGRLFAVDESGYVLRELTSKEHDMMPDLPPGLNSVSVEGLGAQTVDLTAGAAGGQQANAPASPTPLPATKTAAPTAVPAQSTAPAAPQKNSWPLILDRNPAEAEKVSLRPGMQTYTPSTLSAILQASVRLPDVTGESIRWFVPDESSDSIDAVTSTGWHVLLATATPFNVQVDRLSIILKDKIGPKRPELEYVDLRYNEKIFYRLRDQTK